MSGDVIVLRRESIVTLIEGGDTGPIFETVPAQEIIIQREGIPGASVSTVYEHNQASPSAEWIVNHNLGDEPSSISIIFAGGREVEADIVHFTANQFRAYFVTPQTGIVRVSP